MLDSSSSESQSGVVYPTGQSVWLFDGLGGCSIGGGGTCEYNQAKSLLANDGWQVDYASSWRDLDTYRAMFMLAPNLLGPGMFSSEEVSDIKARMSQGLRLIITAEDGLCLSPAITELLNELEASIAFSGEHLDANRIINVSTLADHQVNTGADGYTMVDPCFVDGPKSLFADSEGRVYGAVEQLVSGGEVILIGDSDFFDDSGNLQQSDNSRLIRNLVWIDPALTP